MERCSTERNFPRVRAVVLDHSAPFCVFQPAFETAAQSLFLHFPRSEEDTIGRSLLSRTPKRLPYGHVKLSKRPLHAPTRTRELGMASYGRQRGRPYEYAHR